MLCKWFRSMLEPVSIPNSTMFYPTPTLPKVHNKIVNSPLAMMWYLFIQIWWPKLWSVQYLINYLAPGGGCEVLFSPGLSVCLSVCLCVCVCVCPAHILVFYFSAIRRDIDLKFIQDTYSVVLNSLKNTDLHRSKVKVTGTVHCFFEVQSYHKNWAIEKFQFIFIDTS